MLYPDYKVVKTYYECDGTTTSEEVGTFEFEEIARLNMFRLALENLSKFNGINKPYRYLAEEDIYHDVLIIYDDGTEQVPVIGYDVGPVTESEDSCCLSR